MIDIGIGSYQAGAVFVMALGVVLGASIVGVCWAASRAQLLRTSEINLARREAETALIFEATKNLRTLSDPNRNV